MMLLLLLLTVFAAREQVLGEDEEYSYDSEPIIKKKADGGQRLVGASRAKHGDIKFVVAWNVESQPGRNYASCTGSLITPTWMVSAAHCDTLIPRAEEEKCIKATQASGKYSKSRSVVGCSRNSQGGLSLKPLRPGGKAWIGAEDINTADPSTYHEAIIKQTVHHSKSYIPGGSYGTFGGYDITLVEFEKPVPASVGVPACLPTPSFKDHGVDALLAGYGKYVRPACQTDEFSPYKYHYCQDQSRQASKDGENICDSGPAPVSNFCKEFFASSGVKEVPEGYQEIGVVLENGKLEFCYNTKSPNPKSKGWCKVDGDFYSIQPKEIQRDGWGFCSKDCYLPEKEPESNVLRSTDARVLEEKICDAYLKEAAPNVEVRPEVICVGMNSEWKTKYFKQQGSSYNPLEDGEAKQYRHFGQRLDKYGVTNGYVNSAGTCNGDSGGPVYVMEDGKAIVIGSVSGGRGKMGKCGGINNPVHYVRLSRMAIWIVKVLGEQSAKDLCWHKAFTQKLKSK